MQPHEKRAMLESLESGRQALIDALHGVTGEAAARRPAPGRWSILECVEHLAIAEDYLFGQIAIAHHVDIPMRNERREAAIRARGADRTRPAQSPDVGKPTGRFATLAEALRHFLDSRARTIRFVENNSADLRSEVTSHPIIGTVNCYENLLIIAAHPHRHAAQIAETRSALSALSADRSLPASAGID